MLDQVRATSGERLGADDYLARFWELAAAETGVSWKLERLQHFREPGNESWDAFERGDWDEAVRLARTAAPEIRQQVRQTPWRAIRLRVVEMPLSPYLLWEFQFLKVRDEAGDDIRVLQSDALADLEREDELPEIVTLGDSVLFEVLYDSSGTLAGARQINDPELILACRREFEALFPLGEPLAAFFDREVAGRRPRK